MAETIARCVVCERHEGEKQLNRFREPDRLCPDTPLGPITRCEFCGRLSCPDCQHERECCPSIENEIKHEPTPSGVAMTGSDPASSRALDALVAEKVMGWLRIGPEEPYRLHVDRGGVIASGPEIFRRGLIPEPWFPSDKVADAWDVIESMRQLGFLVSVADCSPFRAGRGNRRGKWYVRFIREGEARSRIRAATGANLPACICTAALFAIGVPGAGCEAAGGGSEVARG